MDTIQKVQLEIKQKYKLDDQWTNWVLHSTAVHYDTDTSI